MYDVSSLQFESGYHDPRNAGLILEDPLKRAYNTEILLDFFSHTRLKLILLSHVSHIRTLVLFFLMIYTSYRRARDMVVLCLWIGEADILCCVTLLFLQASVTHQVTSVHSTF